MFSLHARIFHITLIIAYTPFDNEADAIWTSGW